MLAVPEHLPLRRLERQTLSAGAQVDREAGAQVGIVIARNWPFLIFSGFLSVNVWRLPSERAQRDDRALAT